MYSGVHPHRAAPSQHTVAISWPSQAAGDCAAWLASGYDDMHKVWLSVAPIDMRAGADTPLARVVAVFGCAYPHHPVRVHQSAWQPDQFKAMVIGLPWQRIGTQSAFALV